jgi:AraC-like DNA-binding protein
MEGAALAVHDRLSTMVCHSSDGERVAPDALSELLQDLRLSGASYGRCELTSPWGIEFPPDQGARFHCVVEGGCGLRLPGETPLWLEAGDVALLPHGAGHALADPPAGPTTPLDALPREEVGESTYRLRTGGGGARSLLICCTVTFDEPSLHPLVELMPRVLLQRRGAAADPSLAIVLDTMAAEVSAQRVGAATVMTRLADVVITRVVRAWVEARPDETTGWLTAMRDPQIGRVLAAIHRRPGQHWTVAALAEVAHLSRSAFSERFVGLVGVPPARYVTRWRMHLASVWLRTDRLTVAEVSARLGYESEAAFSRAFKRLVGVPPSALRQHGSATDVRPLRMPGPSIVGS